MFTVSMILLNNHDLYVSGRRRPDIPIPYVLLLDIPIPDIPIPDIPKKKIGISIMFAVFLPNIPIPDIYTRFRNNEHNFTKKCSLFL